MSVQTMPKPQPKPQPKTRRKVEKIFKSFPAYVKEIDEDEGIVTAVVSVFGVVDYGNDRMNAGSFSKTIVERARHIQVLDHHNTHSVMNIIGMPLAMREVGRDELPSEIQQEFPEASGGLETTTQYLLDTPEGLGAFKRIKRGALREYSFGFDPMRVSFSEGIDTETGKKIRIREILEVRMWEYSPVIWGMNPATGTTGFKHIGKEMSPEGIPIRRMGDLMWASVHQTLSNMADNWFASGMLSKDERESLELVIRACTDMIADGVPEMVQNRAVDWWMDAGMMLLSRDQHLALKAIETDEADDEDAPFDPNDTQKVEVEVEDDTDTPVESEDPNDPGEDADIQIEAGPDDQPPTADERQRELDLIEIELATLELAHSEIGG